MVLENFLPETGIYLQLARFLIVFGLGALATRTVLMPVVAYLVKRKNPDKRSVHSIENITALAGLFLSFIFALQAAGFGNLVTVLGTLAAALTVAVGFGIRDQVSNFLGGLIIFTDNPFVKGDYIKAQDFEGVVKEIKLRHTVLNGASSEKLVVPNSALTLNPVKNFTKGRKTRTRLEFEVEPGKTGELEEIALETLEENEEVLEKPEPEARLVEVKDKAEMEVFYWLKDSKDVKEVRSQVLKQIIEKGEEKGLFAGKESD